MLVLTACATEPEVPSLSGRWHGTVEAPQPATLTLDLTESAGVVSGSGTFMVKGWNQAFLMAVSGTSSPDRVTLIVSNPEAVTWTLEVAYEGVDVLAGKTVNDWAVRLGRIR